MELFAKMCDATKKGMNEGYVVLDGQKYYSDDNYVLMYLLSEIPSELLHMSDNDKLEWLYDNDYYYYTDWIGHDEYAYIEIDGKLFSIEEI